MGWFWSTEEWRSYQSAYLHHEPRPHELDPVTDTTNVVDLTADLTVLRSRLSKGHRAAVQQGLWAFDCVSFTNTRWMMGLHERAAGRITRSVETWDIMSRWIDADIGYCLGTYSLDRSKPLAFSYFVMHGEGAYYFSSAIEPSARSLPVGHVGMYWAMRFLKSAGCKWLELGMKHTEGIGVWKSGFGGRWVELGEPVATDLDGSPYVHAPLAERRAGAVGVETSA